jgi:hypothetical protein
VALARFQLLVVQIRRQRHQDAADNEFVEWLVLRNGGSSRRQIRSYTSPTAVTRCSPAARGGWTVNARTPRPIG